MSRLQNQEENIMVNWGGETWSALCRVRRACPLVQCITNYVSMDIMANTLLAGGASPAMVHALEEIPDFTPLASSLCLNIGTLTPAWIHSIKAAAATASQSSKPWVLDPVAAGASSFRKGVCLELLEHRPSVIRGNASEILALADTSVDFVSSQKGVDSSHQSTDALEAAKLLACKTGAIVAASGAVDIITDGQRVLGVRNGVPMLQKITATGCAVTALIAAFVSVRDPNKALEATAFALSVFGLAGEVGMEKANGPASLRVNLIDALYSLDEDTVVSRTKISQISAE